MTPERPRKCPPLPPVLPPPRFINKHAGLFGGDAVRLNLVSVRPSLIGRSETLAKQILLSHFCTVGKYLTDCSFCLFALLVFWHAWLLKRDRGKMSDIHYCFEVKIKAKLKIKRHR